VTWTKLDSNHPDHPKIAALSDAAYRLWVSAICYANRHSTDGWVPSSQVRPMIPKSRYPLKALSELARVGLAHLSIDSPGALDCSSPVCPVALGASSGAPPADGFWLHDFLAYQPKASETAALRQKRAEAGRLGGLAKARATAKLANLPRSDPTRSDPVPRERESGSGDCSDLKQLEAWGFKRWGALTAVDTVEASRRLPIMAHELEALTRCKGKRWAYLWPVLDDIRERASKPKPAKAVRRTAELEDEDRIVDMLEAQDRRRANRGR